MKIITIIGARPQFIKAAVVSKAIKEYNEKSNANIDEIIVHTGQHFDANMSNVFFKELFIPEPVYHLGINSLSHGAMTGQMIEKIEIVLLKEKPDWVLVYGDTNSTLAGALAAKKLNIKIAHVESGLRTYDMKIPEEINRVITDRLSDVLFCPTIGAVEKLEKEGFENFNCEIVNCGDVMYDVALFYKDYAKKPDLEIPSDFNLSTIHRQENVDDIDKLYNIMKTFEQISKDCHIILPLHPRTLKKLNKINYNFKNSNIIFIEPVSYLEMSWLLSNCSSVITDSGGLQKEAYFFKKPCLILINTPWVELLKVGYEQTLCESCNSIVAKYNILKDKQINYDLQPYGDGNAARTIVNHIVGYDKRV
jgi:UDP-GlcNAc3NAcA epimerase